MKNLVVFIGFSYEIIIFSIGFVLLLISIKNFLKNRQVLSILLLIIFTNYLLAILFSIISKGLTLYSNIDYLLNSHITDPMTPSSWILLRISYYRITFVFINLAIYFSYYFKTSLFNPNRKKLYEYAVNGLNAFNIFYSLIVFKKENKLFDVILFFLVFIYMMSVYFPFLRSSLNAYKTTETNEIKKSFLYLSFMSLCYISVLFCLFLDRFLIYLGSSGFTIFYFASWIFVLGGIISAYKGYFR